MSVYGASRLSGCDARLVQLVTDVGTQINVQVVQGARSLADERIAIETGHSTLTDPMDSLHVVDPVRRPLALAVDIAPWPVNWSDIASFESLGALVKARAAILKIPIQWGGDWIHIKDFDHFQLVQLHG